MASAEINRGPNTSETKSEKVAGFFRNSAQWLRSNWTRAGEALTGAAIISIDAYLIWDYGPSVMKMPAHMQQGLSLWIPTIVGGLFAGGLLLINHSINRNQTSTTN